MAKCFVIDVSRCSGCFNCQLACKDEHAGNDWTPYAKAQPMTGQFWCKVHDHVQGTIPKVKIHYTAQLCNHCENPSCIPSCKFDAIYRREDGFVIIDPAKCTGCRECMDACPYDAIYFNDGENICQKCTGCAHLLDNGYKLPRCVEACPTDCMKFGDEEDFADEIAKATVLLPETGNKPKVYYLNVPGPFIGGLVYDPIEKEVIIGGKCTLVGGGKTYTAETDSFGDFWFKNLPANESFTLTLSAEGFEDKVFENLVTEKSINLGDIPLAVK